MRIFLVMLIMLVAVIAPSIVIAVIGYASIRALGRNPFASPKILLSMIMAFIFAVAISIIVLLIVFMKFI